MRSYRTTHSYIVCEDGRQYNINVRVQDNSREKTFAVSRQEVVINKN